MIEASVFVCLSIDCAYSIRSLRRAAIVDLRCYATHEWNAWTIREIDSDIYSEGVSFGDPRISRANVFALEFDA